jgi:hypothetical protein
MTIQVSRVFRRVLSLLLGVRHASKLFSSKCQDAKSIATLEFLEGLVIPIRVPCVVLSIRFFSVHFFVLRNGCLFQCGHHLRDELGLLSCAAFVDRRDAEILELRSLIQS